MAFPVVQGRQTGSTTTNAGTHTITFPAGIVTGELLLAFVASDGAPILGNSEGRWTKIGGQQGNTGVVNGAVFAKEATGVDGLTVTTPGTTEMISWVTMRISGHGGIPTATAANGSSTNSNPPAHTPPWGAQDYLWIAARMGDAQVPATAAPASYTTLTGVTHSNTAGACVHTAERQLNATSQDPGTFTSAAEQWAAFTVAVPPAGMPTPQLFATYQVGAQALATSSLTSSSFTPEDGELIVVKVATADTGCVPSVPTAPGVTFTSQATAGTSGSFGYVRVATARIGTSPGSISITQAFTGTGRSRAMVVERWRSAQVAASPATQASTGSGAPSTTLTTTAANSVASWVIDDWNSVAPGAYAYRSTVNETYLFDYSPNNFVGYFGYQHAPTTGSQTYGLSAPAGQAWSSVAVEIQFAPLIPTVDAGVDASVSVNSAFARTMGSTGSPTSYTWTVISGPAGLGVVGSAAALSWTPTAAGVYVLQADASNANGAASPDTMTLTVNDVSGGGGGGSPVVDASSPAVVTDPDLATVTTAAFNPVGPSLLVACLAASHYGTTTYSGTNWSVTNNSTALSWTELVKRSNADRGAAASDAAIWAAVLPSGRTGMTVTATATPVTGSCDAIVLSLYVVTGAQIGPTGTGGFSTTNSLTTTAITTSADNSLLFAVGNDYSESGAPTSSDLTLRAGDISGAISYITGYKSAGSAGSAATANLDGSGTSSVNWTWVVTEIPAASVAAVIQGKATPRNRARFRASFW